MEPPKRTARPDLFAAIERWFGVAIHPAEAGMIHTGEEMADLLQVKIDSAGLGKQWPATRIWRELRELLADFFGDWPEDIQPYHPIRRDEYRTTDE
jgi:hypothetical protein